MTEKKGQKGVTWERVAETSTRGKSAKAIQAQRTVNCKAASCGVLSIGNPGAAHNEALKHYMCAACRTLLHACICCTHKYTQVCLYNRYLLTRIPQTSHNYTMAC